MTTRTERDLLGECSVPAEAYWGIHTERARTNFRLSSRPVPPGLITALARVKQACARANGSIGALPPEWVRAIEQACDEVAGGQWRDQFPLDALQGGAGTSTHMNMNEVLANRANELLGGRRGDDRPLTPLDHVNLHQSTNDVYPTALKVAAIEGFRRLSRAVETLQGAFQRKEAEYAGILKLGRTELQGAVPITLGLEFSAFAEAVARDRWRTFKCEERLRVVNVGGTAVGTGLTAPRRYIFAVADALREVTGLGLARAENPVDATANQDSLVEVSGILKAHATTLIKICEDLRKLHLLGEIRLPALQAGSSLMPGKVNPVLAEAGIQAGLTVMANDLLVTEAVSRGTLQICEFLPLAATALLESLDILTAFDTAFAGHVDALEADEAACRAHMENHPTLVTAFVPDLGYKKAEQLVRDFAESGRGSLREFLESRLGTDAVSRALSPERLTALGHDHA